MNKPLQISAAMSLAVMVGGCAHHRHGMDRGSLTAETASVVVKGEQIQAPNVLVYETGKMFTISWQLGGDSRFVFPESNGVVFEGEVVFPTATIRDNGEAPKPPSLQIDAKQKSGFECKREDRVKFTCTTRQLVAGIYKYTVRVQNTENSQVLKVDPGVIVMPR